ncbi:MAG: acyl carrier protein phosphodiesterase [Wenzhouxiangella sp.]
MNHLAHLVLAGPDEGLQLGAFLGDHIKGLQALEALPPGWARGVHLHRFIDSQCDRHPALLGLLARLQTPWRRYGGIIFDVLFDHLLTQHWDRFGPLPLSALAARTDDLLARHRAALPPRLQRFAVWARQQRLWQRYGERAMIAEILGLIAWRHGRDSPIAQGLELLDGNEEAVETAFLAVFSDLEVQVADWKQVNR